MQLTDDMKKAIEFIKNVGDEIIYYPGGFWAEKNAITKPLYNGGIISCYYPENYIRTNTIKALERRKIVEYVEFKVNQYGHKYPVKLRLK